MATEDTNAGAVEDTNLDKLNANLKKVEALQARLRSVLMHRSTHDPALDAPNQDLFAKAAAAYWAEAMENPSKIIEHQMAFWSKSVTHFVDAQKALAGGKLAAPEDPSPRDRRFAHELWDTHPYFNFIKQQYLINAEAIQQHIDRFTLPVRAQKFPEATSCSIALSRWASARSFFSRAFSRSSSLSFFAWSVLSPPYSLRHR